METMSGAVVVVAIYGVRSSKSQRVEAKAGSGGGYRLLTVEDFGTLARVRETDHSMEATQASRRGERTDFVSHRGIGHHPATAQNLRALTTMSRSSGCISQGPKLSIKIGQLC